MNAGRIEMLEMFMQEDPTDPFPIYALALEYQVSEKEKARQLFEKLLTDFPDYLPVYYMAGNFFMEQNEIVHATKVLQLGLALAKEKNEMAALREIQSVLDSIED